MRRPRVSRLVTGAVVLIGVVSCSAGDGSADGDGPLEWVTGMRPGQCVDPVGPAADDVTHVRRVPCDRPHSMETYARVPYPVSRAADAADDSPSSNEYPGNVALQVFAREACAGEFRVYLGTAPRRPWYFLTYLYPSSASWTAAEARSPRLGPLARLVGRAPRADRSVICVLRTTGPPLSGSVRGRPYPSPSTSTTSPSVSAPSPSASTAAATGSAR